MNDGITFEALMAECQRMTDRAIYDAEEGLCRWPAEVAPADLNECGRCTNGARLIAKNFQGRVVGYPISPNDNSLKDLAGHICMGHDFAIVGDFLVDWWAWDYEVSIPRPVLHLLKDDELIWKRYKPACEWNDITAQTRIVV